MSNDKMREEFEVVIAADIGISVSDIKRCRKEETYTTDALYYAWWAWQASRKALVIELPEHYQYDNPGEAFHAIKDCREAIEAAGVKVTQ